MLTNDYSESYAVYRDANSTSQSPPQSTVSMLVQYTSSTSAQPTSSIQSPLQSSVSSDQSTSSTSEPLTSSTSEQPTSSTSGQLTSSTSGQPTSFVANITTPSTTSTDTVANPYTPTTQPTDSPTNANGPTLTFIQTETATQVQVVTGEPAIQAPTSSEPSAPVVQNSGGGIDATWAIIGSVLGAAASIATIWMCIRVCGGRGGA
jgi:hypothetical protein